MLANPFAGTWKLVSYEVRRADGRVSYPWGEHPEGRLIYTGDGHVSVAMMASDRRKFDAGEMKHGTLEEKAAAIDSYISYSGTYEVGGGKVVHHVEVSLFPNWVCKDQVRNFQFDGDRLMLSTDPAPEDEKRKTGHLIWERI
jgi:hypothetical protein